MRRLAPTAALMTFTGRFPGHACDEGPYAHQVVRACDAVAHEVAPTPERFVSEASRLYWHAEFPIGGLSQFAQWCVFDLAREHGVTVLLDGQGSDELLGGYGNQIVQSYLTQLLASGYYRQWRSQRTAWARQTPALFSWPRILLATRPAQPLRALLQRWGGRPRVHHVSLARADWLAAAQQELPRWDADDHKQQEEALSHTLWTLAFRTMLSSLLRFGDRLSMAHSREVRLPFCDHRVAELAFSLSPELLVGNGQVKRVLRAAAKDLVPPAITTRRKQGFVPPQEEWLAGPLASWGATVIDGADRVLGHVLDTARARAAALAPVEARRREAGGIWHALNLACWAQWSLTRMREQVRVAASD